MSDLETTPTGENPPIGYVTGGGLEANLQVRLEVPAHEVQEGAFVVTDSDRWRFYGLVTDLQLAATDERFAAESMDRRFTPKLSQLLREETLYTTAEHPFWVQGLGWTHVAQLELGQLLETSNPSMWKWCSVNETLL